MMTFNKFCEKWCDGLYDPKLPMESQCTGYKELRSMVENGIAPAPPKELIRYLNSPTMIELVSVPDIKYMRFLHPLLRNSVSQNWNFISKLKL